MKEIDVRPILEAGGEPFDEIMKFVSNLLPGEGFRLWATFKPEPLLAVLSHKGFRGDAQEISDGNWAVEFTPVS